ncbi:MAG: riboflavin kinase, partial [Firmicutes bacterium]|nr:riboflavin kinase [Bacillota bacterium]
MTYNDLTPFINLMPADWCLRAFFSFKMFTVGVFKKNIETHVFNFDKELYGKFIKIEFIRMTRPEAKFASIEDLKA